MYTDIGIERLSEAIVERAMKDIVENSKDCVDNRSDAIRFLKGYCYTLTGIDGNYLLEKMKEKGFDYET